MSQPDLSRKDLKSADAIEDDNDSDEKSSSKYDVSGLLDMLM